MGAQLQVAIQGTVFGISLLASFSRGDTELISVSMTTTYSFNCIPVSVRSFIKILLCVQTCSYCLSWINYYYYYYQFCYGEKDPMQLKDTYLLICVNHILKLCFKESKIKCFIMAVQTSSLISCCVNPFIPARILLECLCPFLSLSLSVALSRHLGITDPSIHQSEEELRKSHISHHSPLTFFVCIQTYFSLQLDVRGPEKNREYIHVLYPIMSRDL